MLGIGGEEEWLLFIIGITVWLRWFGRDVVAKKTFPRAAIALLIIMAVVVCLSWRRGFI
jgi:hypothetical protein